MAALATIASNAKQCSECNGKMANGREKYLSADICFELATNLIIQVEEEPIQKGFRIRCLCGSSRLIAYFNSLDGCLDASSSGLCDHRKCWLCSHFIHAFFLSRSLARFGRFFIENNHLSFHFAVQFLVKNSWNIRHKIFIKSLMDAHTKSPH